MWSLNGKARTAPASNCPADDLEGRALGPDGISQLKDTTSLGEPPASSLHAALPPTPLQPQRLSTPGGIQTAKHTPECNADLSQPAHDSFQAVCLAAAGQMAAEKAVTEDVRNSLRQRIQQELLAAQSTVAEVTPLLPILASKDTSSFSKAQVNNLDWLRRKRFFHWYQGHHVIGFCLCFNSGWPDCCCKLWQLYLFVF